MTDKTAYLCPQCQIGHLQAGKTTYVRVVGGMVVSVPEMVSSTCDVCGYQEFDAAALTQLEALLGEVAISKGGARPTLVASPPDGSISPHSLKP